MTSTDEAILGRWIADRDAEAFKALATKYAPMVYNTCKRVLGNVDDARDASQECFLALA